MENGIRILILEHDPKALELLQFALKETELTYISKVVQTKEAFETTLVEFKPEIILSEYSLPTLDGLSAFKIKEQLLPGTPFLIISGPISGENAVELIKSGVTDYVFKEKLYQIGPKIQRALKEAQARKQKEIADSELTFLAEQFRKVTNLSLDVIYTLDIDGKFITVSPAAKLILDYQPEELIGRHILDFIHEADKPKTAIAFENLKYGIDILNLESRYLRKSGIPVTLLLSVRLHSDDLGYGVAKDISEIKKAQKELKHKKKQLHKAYQQTKNILESISEGFFAVDKDWIVTYWNKVAEQLLLTPKEAILGKNLWEVFSKAIGSNSYLEYHRAMEEQVSVNFQDYFPPLDRWYEINAAPSKEGLTIYFKDITEIKIAREKIDNNEKRFRALLQNSTDGLTLLAADGTVIERSPSAIRLLELDPTEVSGKFRIDLVHPDDLPLLENLCKKVKQKAGNITTVEYRMLMPNGNYKWIETTLHNQLEEPAVNAIVLNFRDITKRKLSEIRLKKSEMIRKKAQEIAHLGSWHEDLETGKTIWSEETYKILGLKPFEAEPSFQLYFSFVHPEDLPAVKREVVTSRYTKQPSIQSHRIIRKDGNVRYIYSESKFEFDPQSKETILFGIIQDITDKKLAELALEQSEKKYRSIFKLSPLPMWVFDVETYRFLNVNEAARKHYGYTKEEFLAMTIKDIRPDFTIEMVEEAVAAGKHTGAFFQGIFNHVKKDGEIIQVEIQSNLIEYEGRKSRLVLARDISERLKYMHAVEQQNKKLRDIAWIQSHVVRAPLARIMGLISLLKDNAGKERDIPKLVDYLTTSADELDNVIRNIIKETENVEKMF